MKEITFQNIFNQELVKCDNPKDIEIIDGVEYIRVTKSDKQKSFLMRKDSLKRITSKKTTKDI